MPRCGRLCWLGRLWRHGCRRSGRSFLRGRRRLGYLLPGRQRLTKARHLLPKLGGLLRLGVWLRDMIPRWPVHQGIPLLPSLPKVHGRFPVKRQAKKKQAG